MGYTDSCFEISIVRLALMLLGALSGAILVFGSFFFCAYLNDVREKNRMKRLSPDRPYKKNGWGYVLYASGKRWYLHYSGFGYRLYRIPFKGEITDRMLTLSSLRFYTDNWYNSRIDRKSYRIVKHIVLNSKY